MIIKGKSRGGPAQLARHLLRQDTNEEVKILQLDSPTGSLREALRDWQLIAAGTQGSLGLYHANISPDARYVMTPEQWTRTVDVLEKELGFEGQPRAIVFHEKEGRQHVHVVWQRTDIDTMTMVPDSFNYMAHERASLALEQEFGHEHVPGKHAKRDKSQEMPRAEITHAEWQQGERTGIDPREFKETITAIYKSCDNAQAFQAALNERGLIVARGDRRPNVIVDELGQVYSLTRQIKDVPPKDVNAFMAGIDRSTLPTIEEAKALQSERAQAATAPKAEPPPEQLKPPAGLSPEEIEQLREILNARHLEETKRLTDGHTAERTNTARILNQEIAGKIADIDALQKAALARYDREHSPDRTGFAGFVAAIRARFNPEGAAAEVRERAQHRENFINGLATERDDKIALMQGDRDKDLSDLAERHAQQIREQQARHLEDLTRRIRDHEEAQRFLARIEEQRRLDEERRRQEQTHGPEPPKLTQ